MRNTAGIMAATVAATVVWAGVCERLWAVPGEGIPLGGDVSLSPFVQVSATYDDNVFLDSENERDDLFVDFVGGLSLLKERENMSANLRGWFQARRYQDFDVQNQESFQESFSLSWGDPYQFLLGLTQRYTKVDDYEFDQSDESVRNQSGEVLLRLLEGRSRRVERRLSDVGVALARQTDKLAAEASFTHGDVDYKSDDLFDWVENQGGLVLAYRVTDKNSATLSGDYGVQSTDNGLTDDPTFVKARLGSRIRMSDKTHFSGGVGYEGYRAETSAGQEGNLDQDILNYDASGVWRIREDLDFQLYGRNEVLPTTAFTSNTRVVSQGSVGLIYSLTTRLRTAAGFSLRNDDYRLPVEDEQDPEETILGYQLRADYTTRGRMIRFYGNLRYERLTSNIQDDYDQLRATLGVNATY